MGAYGGLWGPIASYGGLWGLMGTPWDLWEVIVTPCLSCPLFVYEQGITISVCVQIFGKFIVFL